MLKIKYDINLMKFISLFENLTRAKVKDCIEGETLTYIVENGEISKAIGKGAINIQKIEGILRRKIKVVEFNENLCSFVANLIRPLRVENITEENGIVTITDKDNKTKGLLIGRNAKNLANHKNIVSRYFEIQDIVVR